MARQIPNAAAADYQTTNSNRQQVQTVMHVAHLHAARSIATDGQIVANPVSDESKLKHGNIRVVWLSPNFWHDGSRYGCIGFSYDLASLLRGKQLYWVEAMNYRVNACRILVTNKISDQLRSELTEYSLTGPGPLIFDDGKYWFNSTICLELMIESSLPLADVCTVNLVNHHPDYCAIKDDQQCIDRYRGKDSMVQYFMSALLAEENKHLNNALKREGGIDLKEVINKTIQSICNHIDFSLSQAEHADNGVLVSLFGIHNQPQDDCETAFDQLAPQLPSEEILKADMLNFANKHFDLS